LTHILLGGAIGQGIGGKRLGRWAFWVGALAATVPDFDVFIRTGNVMWNHALHRHFMHSLVMVPVVAAIVAGVFLARKSLRPEWRVVGVIAFLACLSHTLLDSLTSYGTMMFWPFSGRRVSLDIVAVVDVVFTGILLVGVVWSGLRIRRARLSPTNSAGAFTQRPAVIAIAVSCLYLGFAAIQHGRASAAQRQWIMARGFGIDHVEDGRVLPQIGTVVNYRSPCRVGDVIYEDAIRVPWFGGVMVKQGERTTRVHFSDLHAVGGMAWEFGLYEQFADGYVVRDAEHPEWLGDVRYTATIDGSDSIWALQLERTPVAIWHTRARVKTLGGILRELVWPAGYSAIRELTGE
jgi:inner membrane protein